MATATLARRLEKLEAGARTATARWAAEARWAKVDDFVALAPDGAALLEGLRRAVTASRLRPPGEFLPDRPEDARLTAWRILRDPAARRLYAEVRRRWAETMPAVEPWPWEAEDAAWWPDG